MNHLYPTAAPIMTPAIAGLMRRRWSVAELDDMVQTGALDEDEPFELLNSEIVPMWPKGLRHELARQALNVFFLRNLPDEIACACRTTFRMSEDTFVEPDFVFYRAADGLANLTPKTCLLAVEVADSSFAYDLGRKAHLYAVHGVREVWAIEAKSLVAHVHAEPGVDGYRRKDIVQPDAPLNLWFAPELELRLGALALD